MLDNYNYVIVYVTEYTLFTTDIDSRHHDNK